MTNPYGGNQGNNPGEWDPRYGQQPPYGQPGPQQPPQQQPPQYGGPPQQYPGYGQPPSQPPPPQQPWPGQPPPQQPYPQQQQPQQQQPQQPWPGQPPYPQQQQQPYGWQQQPWYPQQPYPQQQQQPGGQGGDPGGQPQKKGNAGIWAIAGGGVAVLAILAVLLFAWPGWLNTTVFDNDKMSQDVKNILVHKYKVDGVQGKVSCPSDQPVEQGNTFHCQVTVNGEQQKVKITVKDAGSATYDVSQPR